MTKTFGDYFSQALDSVTEKDQADTEGIRHAKIEATVRLMDSLMDFELDKTTPVVVKERIVGFVAEEEVKR